MNPIILLPGIPHPECDESHAEIFESQQWCHTARFLNRPRACDVTRLSVVEVLEEVIPFLRTQETPKEEK